MKFIVDIARRRIENDFFLPAIYWLAPDIKPVTYTYGDYFARAAGYAEYFLALGLKPNELVVLIQPPSPEVIFAFWGALLIGALPSIFPFQSEKIDPERYVHMVTAMLGSSKPTMVVTTAEFSAALINAMRSIPIQRGIVSLPESPTGNPLKLLDNYRKLEQTDIAFLQHSSGTTGAQKGVPITHRALLRHLDTIADALEISPDEIFINWLPLYHDMGLICGMILPCRFGCPTVMMSPFDWVRNPKQMLWAFHNFHGTTAWMPNFAFQFMATRIADEDLAGLNLSSIKRIVNCSEPVRAISNQLFRDRFSPYGFDPNAITIMYGAAENVISIALTNHHQKIQIDSVDRMRFIHDKVAVPSLPTAEFPMQFVSCGTPMNGVQVQVVDENNSVLSDRHVGELRIFSEFLFSGYYQRPDLTASAFDSDGWYHTGDLGYMSDGELFVTGRKKDLIIVGGKNIYPEDLEDIIQRVPGIKMGRSVAFGMVNESLGTEDIYVIAESLTTDRNELRRIERDIRLHLSTEADVTARRVILKTDSWMVKSTSGKVSRTANRDKYLAELEQIH